MPCSGACHGSRKPLQRRSFSNVKNVRHDFLLKPVSQRDPHANLQQSTSAQRSLQRKMVSPADRRSATGRQGQADRPHVHFVVPGGWRESRWLEMVAGQQRPAVSSVAGEEALQEIASSMKFVKPDLYDQTALRRVEVRLGGQYQAGWEWRGGVEILGTVRLSGGDQ